MIQRGSDKAEHFAFNYLKRGRYLICQHSEKGWGGRERERERGVTRRVCFCVGERHREGEGGGV